MHLCLDIKAEYEMDCLHERAFSDVYDQGVIDSDLRKVEERKAIFAKRDGKNEAKQETKLRSEAMEAIIAHHGDSSEWFGSEAHIIKTTDFDDILRGIDFVLEFDPVDRERVGADDGVPRIALAIDATSSHEMDTVSEKMDRNIKKIFDGDLEVKYFASQIHPEDKGAIRDVVPVVIGIESENINQLIDDVHLLIRLSKIQNKTPDQKQSYAELRNKVDNSPAQIIFIKEMVLQLEMYARMMENKGKTDLLKQVRSLVAILKGVYDEKRAAGLKENTLASDNTFQTIRNYTIVH